MNFKALSKRPKPQEPENSRQCTFKPNLGMQKDDFEHLKGQALQSYLRT
jgi:hypothetical protein